MTTVIQISRHERSQGAKRFLKRQAARTLRRLARRDPQNAPRRLPWREYSR